MFLSTMTLLPDAVEKNLFPPIEIFDCPFDTSAVYSGVIRIVFPEFTCVCPKTGNPDFAAIHLLYLPDKSCIELKSWKLYLNAFRMIGTFHESVTAHLFKTILNLLKPKWCLVIGDFFPRGNVDTTVVFETPTQRPRGVDSLVLPLPARCRTFDQ